MAPKVLELNQPVDDAATDAIMAKLPPVPDETLVLLKSLQKQVADLAARVEVLEA